MVAPKTVTVNGKEFQLRPLHPISAARVNGQLAAIFGPMLMGQVPEVSKLLLSLSDEKQDALVSLLVSTTLYLPPGEDAQPLELKDPAGLEAAFACDLEGLYTLLLEIMEYNGFPFFKKLREVGERYLEMITKLQMKESAGDEIPGTDGSDLPISDEAKRALNSATSAPSGKTSKKSTQSGA